MEHGLAVFVTDFIDIFLLLYAIKVIDRNSEKRLIILNTSLTVVACVIWDILARSLPATIYFDKIPEENNRLKLNMNRMLRIYNIKDVVESTLVFELGICLVVLLLFNFPNFLAVPKSKTKIKLLLYSSWVTSCCFGFLNGLLNHHFHYMNVDLVYVYTVIGFQSVIILVLGNYLIHFLERF